MFGRLEGKIDGIQTTLANMGLRADGHEARLNDHEIRLTTIETTARTSTGGLKVVAWIIGVPLLPVLGWAIPKLFGL